MTRFISVPMDYLMQFDLWPEPDATPTHSANGTIPVTQGDLPISPIVLTPTAQARHATSTPSAMALPRHH